MIFFHTVYSGEKNAREKLLLFKHVWKELHQKNVTWLPITAAVGFVFVIDTNLKNWPFKLI